MPDLDPATQLTREIAAATVAQQVRAGEATQELLRAARARLEQAALAYAAAHGWQPPRSS